MYEIGLCANPGVQTAYLVDSAYVFGTSGEAVFLRFVSTESQTNGNLTLYNYCTATTGSPTYKAEVRNGPGLADDKDRPEAGGATLDVTAANTVPVASTWGTYSFTNLTLVAGQTYFVILYNTHATPVSNNAELCFRGAADSHYESGNNVASSYSVFRSGYTTNGFTTDPTVILNHAGAFVLKYNSGNLHPYSFPYVDSEAHASNTNDRGNRLSFTSSVKAIGHGGYNASSNINGFEINQGAANIVTVASEAYAEQASVRTLYAEQTLTAATDYDFVITYAVASITQVIFTMGEIEANVPTDVKNARPGSYVDGATPGSYTVDTSKLMQGYVHIGDLVASAGSGGWNIVGPGGLAG